MRIVRSFAAIAFAMGIALPAMATVFRFDITDPDATLGGQSFTPYYFMLDASPTPISYDATSFTLSGTTYGTTIYGAYAVNDTYTFYTAAGGGGLQDNENVYEGPALFTGPTDDPTFQPGSYAVDDYYTPGSVTISDTSSSSTPEPATWAMMVLGMGGIGASIRRRRIVPQN